MLHTNVICIYFISMCGNNTFWGWIAVRPTKKNELNHSNKFFFWLVLLLLRFFYALYPENDDHANDQRLVNFFSLYLHPPWSTSISQRPSLFVLRFQFALMLLLPFLLSLFLRAIRIHPLVLNLSFIKRCFDIASQWVSMCPGVRACQILNGVHTTSETRHFVLCHQFVWPKISSATHTRAGWMTTTKWDKIFLSLSLSLCSKWKKMENNVGTFDKLISYKRKSFKRRKKIFITIVYNMNQLPKTKTQKSRTKQSSGERNFYLDFFTAPNQSLHRDNTESTRNVYVA